MANTVKRKSVKGSKQKKSGSAKRRAAKARTGTGDDNKPDKRPEAAQAQRHRPEGDYGAIAEDEGSSGGMGQRKDSPNRQKAGR